MKVNSFRLIQFRNYQDREVYPKEGINVFIGSNGAGKTNLLESLYVASIGKSYRTNQDEDLILHGKEEGSVMVNFTAHHISHDIRIRLSKNEGKRIFINETVSKKKDLLGLFKTVLFSPDELQLIKGPPQNRRRFIDLEISQINPRYYEEILKYTRAVMQRNAAFKNAQYAGKIADVDLWDMQIASGAVYIVKKRLEALRMINQSAFEMGKNLTEGKEHFTLSYLQKMTDEIVADEEWFLKKLAEVRDEDARFCRTSVGPHRDDILFQINGYDLSRFGSQGQQRTAILALKLGELEFMKKEAGEYPVLLMDDVGSELDESRKKSLFQYVEKQHVQVFVTASSFQNAANTSGIIEI